MTYIPQEKKLDVRKISDYFIDYPEKLKRYRFYDPNHTSRIIETGNAMFIKDYEVSGSETPWKNGNSRMRVQVSLTCVSNKVVVPQVIELISNDEEQHIMIPLLSMKLRLMNV